MQLNDIKNMLVRYSFFITFFLGWTTIVAQTSHVLFPIINLPVNYEFEELRKDTILIVANGYYNTIVKSSGNVKVEKILGNNLFWEVLPLQQGDCIIDVYGVNLKGEESFLGRFVFLIN